ncbi:MAG: DNA polymerase-3 subunit alpha [Alphaproteobacteria bacterium]|jgi:DNA polymerase-3 subunit alpha
MSIDFIHLRVHSAYSLLEGAIPVKKLINLCQDNQMPAIGLTDKNNLFGALEFSEIVSAQGIQPIVGIQMDIDIGSYFDDLKKTKDYCFPVVLLAKNKNGYQNLLKIASRAYTVHSYNGGIEHSTLDDLCDYNEDLILLTGGTDGILGRLIAVNKKTEAAVLLTRLHKIYGNRLYIELNRLGLSYEKPIEAELIAQAYNRDIPLVATNYVMFDTAHMHEAHDALICIKQGAYVSQDDRRKVSGEQYFKTPAQMKALFADLPEAIENTVTIAQRCAFKVETHPPILPAFVQGGDFDAESEELRRQAREGLAKRLEKVEHFASIDDYQKRLEFELDIIISMKFPGYFLIVADFIQWAKNNHIPVGPGRGSGAGSVVAWSLTITDLDPLRFGLLFERFLNPERVSMPDFDIDFCQEKREKVIQYVQKKYGKDRVAQIITFGKLQARAVLRDVGRVSQMSYGQVDRLCKMVPNNPAHPMTLTETLDSEEAFASAKASDEAVSAMIDKAIQLEGLYRHASTHAAGVVISDRPLDALVPVYRDERSDMPVTQFNMKWVEPAGLVKFDFLGLKTLTVIQKAVDLLRDRNIDIDISLIPLDDKKSYEMLGKGDSTGVFQLESTGMRDVLRKMKPDRIEDIIALVALYRPGPMDNIPQYIAVKKGAEDADYLHPWLKDILLETHGVIIYQEQVMQIAQILSGYSLGEADLLRRAMGKKIKAEMDQQRERFVDGAISKSVDADQAGGIFDLVAKFAGYGFNKSHAAAYALVSYQTAYLKANYPVEFMAAVMTFDMSNTDKLVLDKQEVDRLKTPLIPPCVNQSNVTFSVRDQKIHYALCAVKNVGEAVMGQLVQEREVNGLFKDITDFAKRLGTGVINKRTLEFLIKSGAMDCFGYHRKQLLESIDSIVAEANRTTSEAQSGQNSLFGDDCVISSHIPIAKTAEFPMLERLSHEHQALGFYLSAHPLDDYETILKKANIMQYSKFVAQILKGGMNKTKLAGTVSGFKERKSAKGNRFAFVQLSDASGAYEVMIFSDTLNAVRDLLKAGTSIILSVEGETEPDSEQVRLRVHGVQSFDDLPQTEETINIHFDFYNDKEAAILMPKIQTLVKGLKQGTGKISFCVPINKHSQIAKISLSNGYLITAGFKTKLQKLPNIIKIE